MPYLTYRIDTLSRTMSKANVLQNHRRSHKLSVFFVYFSGFRG